MREDLTGRLAALEGSVASLRRENRLLKVALLVVVFLASLPYLMAFQPTVLPVVRAEQFEVVRDGKVVASLRSSPDGGGALFIVSKDGEIVAGLISTPDGGVLGINNKDGEIVAILSSNPYGGSLLIFNKDGKPVAGLGLTLMGVA